MCSCLENPRDGEPDGLPSMGSHGVGHDWSDSAAAAAWDHLQINDDKLVNLCLIHFATELWQAGALPVTLNKGSKLPDLKKFFNIFKTQRDHLVVAKTYLVIPPTFSVSKRDTQADWLGAQETSVHSVQKFLSYLFHFSAQVGVGSRHMYAEIIPSRKHAMW